MDAVHEVLGRSALVSLTATAVALALGVPVGTWLALAHRRGRRVLATAVNTGMAIPTVVVGLVVALLLWRSGPLGDLELIYTLRGMIIPADRRRCDQGGIEALRGEGCCVRSPLDGARFAEAETCCDEDDCGG